ncbi:MAG: hypothetical protein ACI4TD_10030, partial [Phocaeicola sp.]
MNNGRVERESRLSHGSSHSGSLCIDINLVSDLSTNDTVHHNTNKSVRVVEQSLSLVHYCLRRSPTV